MVDAFGLQRDLAHEGEGFGKVGEAEFAADRIAGGIVLPLRQLLEQLAPGGVIQSIHRRSFPR